MSNEREIRKRILNKVKSRRSYQITKNKFLSKKIFKTFSKSNKNLLSLKSFKNQIFLFQWKLQLKNLTFISPIFE